MVTRDDCLNQIEDFLSLDTGVEVFYRCWFPSENKKNKDIVVGVYGLAEHSGRCTHLGKYLAKNGYGFCMMDLRGHGRTAEKTKKGYVKKRGIRLRLGVLH